MSDGQTIEAMRTAARALRSDDDLDSLRAIQAAQDALDAAKAERMHRVDTSRAFEADGASSISTWARTHLRLDAREAKQLVRSGSTLQALDAVADDAHAGRIRAEHVAAFTYGIRHVDRRIIADAQSWLLDVARTCEPAALRRVMRGLREAIYPDSLDAEWAKGMDRQDVQLNAVPDGWHLNGFLSTTTGAKLKTVLDSLSTPTSADDQRTAADRRVTAVDDLCTRLLESGLPADKGVRPHLSVIVEPEAPARLAGFGAIGPQLLEYLTCGADVTGILTDGGSLPQAQVLNVGRTHRLATLKQRRAIIARQDGQCAAPGCHHTHLEIHHVTPYSEGGRTNLDEMVGLCVRCHHLVHRGTLQIRPTSHPGLYDVQGRDPRPGHEAYRRRRDAWRETRTIRRIAHHVRERHESRLITPMRT